MSPGLHIPLTPSACFRATLGEELRVELGSVLLSGADPRGLIVVVDVGQTEGRGRVRSGLRFPEDPEPVWSETVLPLNPQRFAIPMIPEADGQDRLMTVVLRLQPLGVGRACSAWIQAYLQFPPVAA